MSSRPPCPDNNNHSQMPGPSSPDGDDATTTSSFVSLLPPLRNVTDMMVGTSRLAGFVRISLNPNTKDRRIWYKFYLLARPYD